LKEDQPLVPDLKKSGRPHVRISVGGTKALDEFRHRLEAGEYELHEAGCLCGASDRVLVAEEDRYGLPFRTYLCRACGLVYTTPRMTEKSVARFYEVDYRPIYRGSSKASDTFFEDQVRHGRQVLRRVKRHVGQASKRRIFDIGCGAGGVLVPFKEQGWDCFGCDYNPQYLERGKEAGLTLETGSFESLRQHGPADLIVASHVLEHCLDPVQEVHGWASLLSPDGLLYIEVPGLFDVYRNYKSLVGFFHVAHTFNFTLGTLTHVAAKAGLKRLAGNESVWALFAAGDQPSGPANQASDIERFLERSESGISKAPRELRRHFLRLSKSAAKRLPGRKP
jgi:2-polyprenyl-3-methyl-5-hydroxy-6-metoxy-1,4-benzoquinol methylase